VLREFVKRELMSEEAAENMLTWPHSGFHVHLGPLIHDDEAELLATTARYCARAPLSLYRLSYDSDIQTVTYAYTNPYDNTDATEILTPLELIARLSLHIPNVSFAMQVPTRTEHAERGGNERSPRERSARAPRHSGGRRAGPSSSGWSSRSLSPAHAAAAR
jgi:hypothetical protein